MFSLFKRRPSPEVTARTYSIPSGERVYAIGDVHGCHDQLVELIAQIEADDAARPAAQTTLIFLGDLVDRGPASADVVATARALAGRRAVRFIAGNHEEMFLGSLERVEVLRHFLQHGGRETALSYGISLAEYREMTFEELQAALIERVPAGDLDFLRSFEDVIAIGDYVFVHAGIKPDAPLGEQATRYTRWIREPFLSDASERSFCVVHGHTITSDPDVQANRVGVDTGAYYTGRLTAIGLEGAGRWFLQAGGA